MNGPRTINHSRQILSGDRIVCYSLVRRQNSEEKEAKKNNSESLHIDKSLDANISKIAGAL